ncbi:hypothetical protein Pyn_36848 [Prunus yedoensis var. nudiflora]|uniref:Uncharacterized protein n=1 Tax=Prunus yedoensis var. nudiflora TaxID=2094558 RepID=A0A314UU01_PRUYE|nr:hypothetical protein Pyn_36848 [Prunus yedoensis var. nudiflora]
MSEIAMKTGNEEEFHGGVRVLDQPDKWCIYRVPSKLRNVNEAAYTPQLLSIGPFHHGKPELKDMETHKKIYYENFLARCKKRTIELDIDPADIIVVDACFIIELFLTNFYETENHKNDYILRLPWLRKAVEQDLILFENQLPYSLLQEIYHDFAVPVSRSFQPCKEVQEQTHSSTNDFPCCLPCSWRIPCNEHSIEIDEAKPADDEAEPADYDPLLELTFEFFKDYNKGKSVKNRVKPKHFTDLVRNFLCPDKKMDCEHNSAPVKNIYAAKKLRASGVKFRALKDGPLIIEKDEANKCKFNLACFRNMDLKLTPFCVKDETECVVRNIMALEQFLYPDKPYICNYFLLMDQLVDTVDDVDFGGWEQTNMHYENFWNRHVATLKRVYFKDLWTGSSTVLGVVVLVFSVIGTIKSLMS